jgi:hypothetical protein
VCPETGEFSQKKMQCQSSLWSEKETNKNSELGISGYAVPILDRDLAANSNFNMYEIHPSLLVIASP